MHSSSFLKGLVLRPTVLVVESLGLEKPKPILAFQE